MPLLRVQDLRPEDLVLIELPASGEWVCVKPRLSRGDEIAIQQQALSIVSIEGGRVSEITDKAGAIEMVEFATLERALVSWSFEGVAITAETIRALDGESIDVIKERLNELYPGPRKEEERRDLSGSGPAPSSVAASPQLRSVGSR